MFVDKKKNRQDSRVKTSIILPGALWQAAKIRAIEERADLRTIIAKALKLYLRGGPQ